MRVYPGRTIQLMQAEFGWTFEKCIGYVAGLVYRRAGHTYPVNPVKEPKFANGFALGINAGLFKSELINSDTIWEAYKQDEQLKARIDARANEPYTYEADESGTDGNARGSDEDAADDLIVTDGRNEAGTKA